MVIGTRHWTLFDHYIPPKFLNSLKLGIRQIYKKKINFRLKGIRIPLTPNDPYIGRTAPLTSKRCILYIYSTNICTENLNMVYTLRFFLFKMQFVS